MFKRLPHRIISFILTLCMIVSVITVGMVGGSAKDADVASSGNIILETITEQLIDDGMRAICIGMDAVGEATGSEDIQEAFSVIEAWCFMDASEVAIEELKEMCQEILDEIEELEDQMESDDTYITAMLANSSIREAKNDLDGEWDSDVKAYLTDAKVINVLDLYRVFLSDALDGKPEDTLRLDRDNLLRAYQGMVDTDTTVYESNAVNNAFIALLSNLKTGLYPQSSADQTISDYAAQLAYLCYPFSHQQYQYVHTIMEQQIMTILLVEMAYNEYLYQQGEYLKDTYHDEDDPNGRYARYLSYQSDFYTAMKNGVIPGIKEMLDHKMPVDGAGRVSLALSDYMKPEDAITTTLHIDDYRTYIDARKEWCDWVGNSGNGYDYYEGMSGNISDAKYIKEYVKFRKVMTHTPAGNNIYYILDPEQYSGTEALYIKNLDHNCVFDGWGHDTHTESCDAYNLMKHMTDGMNAFIGITDKECTGFSDLVATNYFSLTGSTLQGYLASNSVKYLPDDTTNPPAENKTLHNFVLTSKYQFEENAFDTEYTKFTLVDCNQTFPDAKLSADYTMDMESGHNSVSDAYTVILRNENHVPNSYFHKAHAEVSNPSKGSILLSYDDVHFYTDIAPSCGDELTIKMRANDCKMSALKMIRDADYFSSAGNQSEIILLDEKQLSSYTPDYEGYITVHFRMPYSDVTYRLELDESYCTASIETNEGGKAAFEDGSIEQFCKTGEKTDIYITPDEGYALHSLWVEDKNGNKLSDYPLTIDLAAKRKAGEDAYAFTMPAQNVKIKVYFTAGNTVSFDTDKFVYDDEGNKLEYLYFTDDPDADSRCIAPGFKVSFKAQYDDGYEDPVITAKGVTSGKDYTITSENGVFSFDTEQEDVVITSSFKAHNYVNGFCTDCGQYQAAVLDSDGWYQVTNGGNLFWIAALTRNDHTHARFGNQDRGARFELVNDIDLESRQWESIAYNWDDGEFTGQFNGNGYTINNFYFGIEVTDIYNHSMFYGMFGGAQDAKISNFSIKGKADIVYHLPDGYDVESLEAEFLRFGTIIANTAFDTELSDIFTYVDINVDADPGTEIYISGLAHNLMSHSDIRRCVNFGNITGNMQNAAGISIMGLYASSTIEDCANIGTITSTWQNPFEDIYMSHLAGIQLLPWPSLILIALFGQEVSYNNYYNCYNYGYLNSNSLIQRYPITGGEGDGITVENCYSLESSSYDYYNHTTKMTAAQYKSGEVGYKLNKSVTDGTQAWYQNIDNGKTPDDYPLPDKSRGTIYFIESENRYSNYPDGNSPYGPPTEAPTQEPTQEPTQAPTQEPTQVPTEAPTQEPTQTPTEPPYTPTLYTATIEEMTGGTASFSADSVVTEKQYARYDKAEFIVTAPKDYRFASLTVTDKKGKNINFYRAEYNTLTDDTITYVIGFEMPGSDVIIKGSMTEGYTVTADRTAFVYDGGDPIAYIELKDYADNSAYTADPIIIPPYATTVEGRFVYDSEHYPTHLKVVGEETGKVYYDNDVSETETTFICFNRADDGVNFEPYGENLTVIPSFGTKTTPEAPTEPPTEAPTQAPTEAPTEPSTEAPTEPSTEAPTEPVVPHDPQNYGIRTYEELCEFARLVNEDYGTYKNANAWLENNIIAPADSEWTLGIGTEQKPFIGTFDGKGRCIIGLRMYNTDNAGLFEYIGKEGVVKDLMVIDCRSMIAAQKAGGIAAVNDGTIDHCTSGINLAGSKTLKLPNGKVITPSNYNSYIFGNYCGGIAAKNNGTITGTRSGAVVEAVYSGGIAAVNNGKIYGCANNGAVGSTSSSCQKSGGIAAENYSKITSCYDSGHPSCGDSSYQGMIVGDNNYAAVRDVFYSEFNSIPAVGKLSDVKLSSDTGLMSTNDMKQPAFVDKLNDVTDSTITWVRTAYKDTYFNNGFPTIKGRYVDERLLELDHAITVSGMMHSDLNMSIEALSADSDEYSAFESRGDILSAYTLITMDSDGSYVPAELWTSGVLQLTVSLEDEIAPTGTNGEDKHLVLLAENSDGEVKMIAPDRTADGKAVFTVGELRSFAVAMTSACPLGDADGNGDVEITDVTVIQRFDAHMNIGDLTEADLLARADVDGDGEITIIDATFIQRYLVNMNVKYPIGEYTA